MPPIFSVFLPVCLDVYLLYVGGNFLKVLAMRISQRVTIKPRITISNPGSPFKTVLARSRSEFRT
jgi:hypothetical protein